MLCERVRKGKVALREPEVLRAFGPGQWRVVYAASVMDGAAVAVEHWPGQISEGQA